MKRVIMILCVLLSGILSIHAQDKEESEKGGFKKENLFTGGSISVGFSNNSVLLGGNPVFGYSLTDWIDAGLVLNYTYTTYRDYNFVFNDKLRQTVFGGGAFLKLYPVRFLFVQGQFEHNFLKQKFIPVAGVRQVYNSEASSFLLGAGYATGRFGKGGPPFFYLSVMFDLIGDINSPYTDGYGRVIPIVRGGIQVPLFQGSKNK